MKRTFKFSIILSIIALMVLSSCSISQKGFNYSKHSKKGQHLSKQAVKRNVGRNLTEFKCRGRR
jgi:outer membrane protein assembly factor BamE (lipoprotein component of BamABCDE complex)